jgi:pentatricopeptide repeat protein
MIMAITNSGEIDAPNKAEKFLRDWGSHESGVDAAPNRVTFNNLINAWAKSGCPDRAESILQHMDQMSKQGLEGISPDTVSFTSIIVSTNECLSPYMD